MLIRRKGSAGPKVRRARKTLHVEQLESREMNTADLAAAAVSPDWFASYVESGEATHAGAPSISAQEADASTNSAPVVAQTNTFDWIVQFNTSALTGIGSVADTTRLLAGEGIDFQVLRGLGKPGEILARSHGATASTVIDALQSNGNVAMFELDSSQQFLAVPNDQSFSQLWALQNTANTAADIDATDAWSISTGSQNVVVAVIDSGVDYTHPDLISNIWTNPLENSSNGRDNDGNGFANDLHGYDFYDDDGNPMDENGHGTHVAGTIGATGNNGQGVTGVNWSVSIMPLKFLGADGSGYTSDAIRAVNYCTMMRTQFGVNIRVINASWGGGGFDGALRDAIRNAGDAGILFVTAAGNSSTNNDSAPQYPANYGLANVISVAATDQNDQLAWFSCYGASTVNLAAPGVGIYSTYRGGAYGMMSGTSMATPQVAGAAALAWAVAPNASVADIRNAILEGVDQLSSLAGKVASGGRLNVYNTLRILSQDQTSTPVIASLIANPGSISAGGTVALSAQGVAETGGAITGVYFYRDSNANGHWDAGDALIGSTGSIVAGRAAVSMNTAGMAAGNYSLFARAVDANNRWSEAVGTSLTVTPASRYGHNAATANAIGVNGTVDGLIETYDDANFFKFQAVAGVRYTATVRLGSLYDSVMTLFGPDGRTVLALNDDYMSGSLASRLVWQAPTSGTYYLAVTSYPSSGIGTFSLQLSALIGPPTLPSIANQSMLRGGTLALSMSGRDPSGSPLNYNVQTLAIDPTAQLAYDLDQRLKLARTTQYRDNQRGWQERYIVGANRKMYFIVPDGTLYQLVNTRNINKSTVVGRLSSAYWNNPSLLYNATRPSMTPASASLIGVAVSGDTLTLRPAGTFTGNIQVIVTATNGQASASQTFQVTVREASSSNGGGSNGRIGRARSLEALSLPSSVELSRAQGAAHALATDITSATTMDRLAFLRAVDAMYRSWNCG